MPPSRVSHVLNSPPASRSVQASSPSIDNASPSDTSPSRETIPGQTKEFDSANGGNLADSRGEVQKQQKACIHCRKSKVKCVHEGRPPCRRCREIHLECKFRLRADDENWREKTDETLSKLSNAVNILLKRRPSNPPPPPPHGGPPVYYPYPPQHHSPSGSHPHSPYHSMAPPSLPSASGRSRPTAGPTAHSHSPAASIPPPPSPPVGAAVISRASPHSDHSRTIEHSSPETSAGRTRGTSSQGSRPLPLSNTNGEASSNCCVPGPFSFHRRISSMRSMDLAASEVQSNAPPASPGRIAQTASYRYSAPPAVSPHSAVQTLPLVPLDMTQTPPALSLQAVSYNSTPFYLTNPLPMRWTSGISSKESYGAPVAYIGRDDPRLTCVSRSMVPLEKVRQLFMFFAERMQPHSFGFPTFPPTENMTPLIISAIAAVSSLHEPSCRQYHGLLKADVLAAIPDHDLVEGRPLDPELGIGVEEITAACIASAWLGGEEAFTLARLARWWALEYLRHYDLNTHGPYGNRTLTLGEALTILPPFRNIEHSVKVRIWLESYVVEAQQCFILDREPMAAEQTPAQYCESLRTVHSSKTGVLLASGLPSGSAARLSQPDRQLIGHAGLLEILLAVRRFERMHNMNAAQMLGAQIDRQLQGDHTRQRILQISGAMEALDRWQERCRDDEDLSAATPSSMDLTFTYVLARAYIGSQALSIPINSSAPSSGGPQVVAQTCSSSIKASVVNLAKEAASMALDLACEKKGRGFADRIVAMPTWYHFMLGQVVGFLVQLVQRKNRFLLAREARTILNKVEIFVQLHIFEINLHAYQAPSHHFTGPVSSETAEPTCRPPPPGAGRHPASSTAEMMARALAHVKAQSKG